MEFIINIIMQGFKDLAIIKNDKKCQHKRSCQVQTRVFSHKKPVMKYF